MRDLDDVAAALHLTPKFLRYILYGRKARRDYTDFNIQKRTGGIRKISAPPKCLLDLQQKLLTLLKPMYAHKSCVHGFCDTRSIVSNAKAHLGSRFVVNLDLSNFFPTIYFGRVKGVFTNPPFNFGEQAAMVLAQICCHHDGTLPQGGAMSPLISNLVCRGLDNELVEFSKKHKLRYTRYADDLTFSTSRTVLPPDLIDIRSDPVEAGPEVLAVISKHTFAVNVKKVKCRSRTRRQEVTGLTVNQFPNVTRDFVRKIEGGIFAWQKFGLAAAQSRYENQYRKTGGLWFENVLRGRLAFLKMVRGENDYIYRRLARRFNALPGQPLSISVPSINQTAPCPLRNPKSDWNKWGERYQNEVFHLTTTSAAGDISSGSAFHIGGGRVATAGHNIVDNNGNLRPDLRLIILGQAISPQLPFPISQASTQADCGCLFLNELRSNRGIPTQLRLPEIGEEVAAIGFPTIPCRLPTMVMHVGTIEALPVCYSAPMHRFIQVSFQSGGGLSGGCLIDRAGHALGIMVENVFMGLGGNNRSDGDGSGENVAQVPQRPYGQAVPLEYLDDWLMQHCASAMSSNEVTQ